MENTKLTSLDKLQRIAVITPQFRIWTGETVLKATDFIIGEGGELPDSEFASLGRKALIDKQHLNVFRNLRDNFRKECGSIGLPFLGGFAVELSKLDELKPMLDDYVQQFKTEIDNLCANVERYFEDWREKNPKYAQNLLTDKKSVEDVRSRFKAGYVVNKVTPLEGETESLEREVEGLYGVLLEGIREEAAKYLSTSITGSEEVTQKAKAVIFRMMKKLQSLEFLNPEIRLLRRMIHSEAKLLPSKGKLRGSDYWRLFGLMTILSSQKLTEDIISGKSNISSLVGSYIPESAQSNQPEKSEVPVQETTLDTDEGMSLFEGLDNQSSQAEVTEKEEVSNPMDIPLESAVAEETSEVTKQEVKPEASVADLLREEIAKRGRDADHFVVVSAEPLTQKSPEPASPKPEKVKEEPATFWF